MRFYRPELPERRRYFHRDIYPRKLTNWHVCEDSMIFTDVKLAYYYKVYRKRSEIESHIIMTMIIARFEIGSESSKRSGKS